MTPPTLARILFTCAALGVWVAPAAAQQPSRQDSLLALRRAKAQTLRAHRVSAAEARILKIEQTKIPEKVLVRGWRGWRPVIGGAPQGAGFLTGGIGYTRGLTSEAWRADASARISTNNYRLVDAAVEFPTGHHPLPVRFRLDGAWRDLRDINFFGLGNDSANFRGFYAVKDAWGGATLTYTPNRWWAARGMVQYLSVRTRLSDRQPQIEEVFDVTAAPGFKEPRAEFVVSGGDAEFFLRDSEVPAAGVTLRVSGRRYEHVRNLYDFNVLTGEVVTHIPLGYRNRLLALRASTSHAVADGGSIVPFYLMGGVGGASTIRGFRAERFVDRRNFLCSAEYRWEVWTYLAFGLFFDAGKVFADESDLGFSGLHTGYGWSARVTPPGHLVYRFEIGRSKEGVRLYFASGDSRYR